MLCTGAPFIAVALLCAEAAPDDDLAIIARVSEVDPTPQPQQNAPTPTEVPREDSEDAPSPPAATPESLPEEEQPREAPSAAPARIPDILLRQAEGKDVEITLVSTLAVAGKLIAFDDSDVVIDVGSGDLRAYPRDEIARFRLVTAVPPTRAPNDHDELDKPQLKSDVLSEDVVRRIRDRLVRVTLIDNSVVEGRVYSAEEGEVRIWHPATGSQTISSNRILSMQLLPEQPAKAEGSDRRQRHAAERDRHSAFLEGEQLRREAEDKHFWAAVGTWLGTPALLCGSCLAISSCGSLCYVYAFYMTPITVFTWMVIGTIGAVSFWSCVAGIGGLSLYQAHAKHESALRLEAQARASQQMNY